jgi:hypothetical protein
MASQQNQDLAPRAVSIKLTLRRHREFSTGLRPTLVNETPRALPPPLARLSTGYRGRGRSSPAREACQIKLSSVSFFLGAAKRRRGDPGAIADRAFSKNARLSSGYALRSLDCFVASLLAMTVRRDRNPSNGLFPHGGKTVRRRRG